MLHETLHRLGLSQCLSAEDRSCLSQKTEVDQGNIGRANCGAAYNIVAGAGVLKGQMMKIQFCLIDWDASLPEVMEG